MSPQLRHIPLSYNNADSQTSALRIIFTLFPEWETSEGEVKLTRFTDGITNTLLKAAKRRPGLSEKEIDSTAVLLRAYGKGTEVLIDREKEKSSHLLLASHGLAPPLLARFQNGMVYRFIQGKVCSPADLRQEPVWRGVARRLGQWHSVLPVIPPSPSPAASANDGMVERNGHNEEDQMHISLSPARKMPSQQEINAITPGKTTPNLWTVMQRWIFALPSSTEAEKKRKAVLQQELERTVSELADAPGFGMEGLVVAHCDLLSGNVIIIDDDDCPSTGTNTAEKKPAETNGSNLHTNGNSTSPSINGKNKTPAAETVAFIDYEYATPSPAAFDLANHFAEWGGFDCDFSVLPTRSTRRAFLREYLASYRAHLPDTQNPKTNGHHHHHHHTDCFEEEEEDQELNELFEAVDRFRGLPGFYWGIWALIQATISQIDFDYAAYAEVRLGEYWDWRRATATASEKGGRGGCYNGEDRGGEIGVRERRWAEE